MPIPLPLDIDALLKTWNNSSTLFLVIGYGFLGIGLLCSLGVTVFTDYLKPLAIKSLGFAAAASTGILAAFHPIEAGNAFRDAWRVLNRASIEFKLADDKDKNRGSLLDAMSKGEEIIARVQGQVPTTQGTVSQKPNSVTNGSK